MAQERSVTNLRQYLRNLIEGVPGLPTMEGEELVLAKVKDLTDWRVVEWVYHFVTTDPDALHVYEMEFGKLEDESEQEFPLPKYIPETGLFSNHDPWAWA